jgi:hypothetical protein
MLLIAISLLIFSCNKKYHVVGRVYNPVNGEGLANVKVELLQDNFGGIDGGGSKEVATTLTDANGNYDLSFKGQADYIQLELYGDLYQLGNYYEGSYHTVRHLEPKKTQQIDWHVVPYGLYNAHVENVNCAGQTDSMQLRKKYQYDDYGQYWSPYRVGCYNSTSTQPLTLPMGYYYFETKVTRSGVTTYVYDTVFVDGTGTSFLEILY